MVNHTHNSYGSGDFRVELDVSDSTEEITEAIQTAIQMALFRIGLECEAYAKKLCRMVTGRLRNSITNYVECDSVYMLP